MRHRHLTFSDEHAAYGVLLDSFDTKVFIPLPVLQKFSLDEDPTLLTEEIINALCVTGYAEYDEAEEIIMTAEGDEAFMSLWDEFKHLADTDTPETAESVLGWGISVTRRGVTQHIGYENYNAAEAAYHDWARDVPDGKVTLISRTETYGAWVPTAIS